ncbi:hypothetical protein BU054_04490, partial [Staphylococcus simulans]
ASDFLQIPPHDGHPCLSLTVPTAKPVMDFHHQVVNHAERTQKVNCVQFKTQFTLIKPLMHIIIDIFKN